MPAIQADMNQQAFRQAVEFVAAARAGGRCPARAHRHLCGDTVAPATPAILGALPRRFAKAVGATMLRASADSASGASPRGLRAASCGSSPAGSAQRDIPERWATRRATAFRLARGRPWRSCTKPGLADFRTIRWRSRQALQGARLLLQGDQRAWATLLGMYPAGFHACWARCAT